MPFNATAVKYTYEREAKIAPTAMYMGPVNYSNPVTIVDDYTVKINLVNPMPIVFPNFLAIGFGNSMVYSGANDTGAFKVGTGRAHYDYAIVCDQCVGAGPNGVPDPQCAKICPSGVFFYAPPRGSRARRILI